MLISNRLMRRPTCSICTSCSDSSLLWVFPKTSPETITFFSVTGTGIFSGFAGKERQSLQFLIPITDRKI